MGRTRGATNRTPRELDAAGRALIKEAKLKQQIQDLKKKNEKGG